MDSISGGEKKLNKEHLNGIDRERASASRIFFFNLSVSTCTIDLILYAFASFILIATYRGRERTGVEEIHYIFQGFKTLIQLDMPVVHNLCIQNY